MAVNVLAMGLMPVSQATAWYLIVKAHQAPSLAPFYSAVYMTSAFYCAWALYNRFLGGVTQELGYISMGTLAICAFLEKRIPSIIGTGLVLANFGLPAFMIFSWSAEKLARTFKKSDSSLAIVWAYTFKLYFLSNLCLWIFVLYKFANARTSTDNRTIGYQTVET